MPTLTVITGHQQGRIIELADGHHGIGRAPDNAIHVADDALSAHHAEIIVSGRLVILRDLASRNGTFVNGERIHLIELRDGDRLLLGAVAAQYTAGPAPVVQPAPAASAPGGRVYAPGPLLHEQMGADTPVFDKRAVLAGLAVSALLLLVAGIWKLAPHADLLKRQEEFEFKVVEPNVEDFTLKDPIRDILKERPEQMPETVQDVETPDIQLSTAPEPVIEQAIVQTRNVEIETPKIEVTATEMDIQDAPLDIVQTADMVTYAVQPIAVDTLAPADFFKLNEPNPPDRPLLYTINQAPRPSRNLQVLPKAFGEQDVPTLGPLAPMNINLFGTSDFFRTMERAGGVKALAAVDAALHWLAVRQEPDGMWLAEKYEGDTQASLAVTGLSTLAFLGAGHTTRKGEYRRNVLKALEAIIRNQKPDGRLDWRGANHYTHAICTIALCEAYGRARDERIGAAAQKAVNYCEKVVLRDGGWRYAANSDASDMSVSAWFIQALKTAKLAQLKVDNALYSQASIYVDSVTDQGASRDSNGVVTYMYRPDQFYGSNSHPALTAAGMMIRQFNGMGVKNHILVKGAELTKSNPPSWNRKDFYYWYYATYAMHNMGGEYRLWWNQRVRDVLLEHQSRDGENAGSWDPAKDRWADKRAGRVYTTALGALCLEVYYRYSDALNSFGVAPDLDELFLE
jgi:hypothetical protein